MNANAHLESVQSQHTARLKGITCMLVAIGAFAALDTFLKLLSEHYPTLQVMVMRGAASVPFLALPAIFMGRARDLKPVRWGWHVIRGIWQVGLLSTFIFAVGKLSLGDTYAIFLSAPLMVTALSVPLFKEHVGWRRWVAIAVGMSGVLVMLKPTGSNLASIGALAAVVSAAMYAATVLSVRMLSRTETPASLSLWPMVAMVVLATPYVAPNWVPIKPEHWTWLVATGLVGAIGIRLLTEAFKHAPASVVAPFEYTALIYGVGIDWLLWRNLPSVRVCVGGTLVIASGLFLIWRERQLHRDAMRTVPTPAPP